MEHDFIKTAEVVGRGLKVVHDVGKFVVDRLVGGAWGILAAQYNDDIHEANMEHLNNVVRGTE